MRSSFIAVVIFGVTVRAALAISGVDTPPPPAPPHEINFTQPKETKLENGVRVIVAERPDLPLLATEVVVQLTQEQD